MSDINERVKELRKDLGLTQEEFAKKIGIKGGSLSMIELGRSPVTEQNILLICALSQIKPYQSVSESWLRSGEGKMFVDHVGNNHQEHELLEIYRNLLLPNRKVVLDNASELLKAQKAIIEFKAEDMVIKPEIQEPELTQMKPHESGEKRETPRTGPRLEDEPVG
jgi:transcriptional regulator with XRE-family HTH domain